MFRRELKDNVKDELLYYKKTINSINSLIYVLIKVDNKLYKKAIKKKFNNLRRKAKTYTSYLAYKKGVLRENIKNNWFKNPNYIGLILIKFDFI